ncbi:FAD-containing monooxygenase EthA [Fusarium oxysporum f. sp. albedinis]|nr:FAD-containing monooxygenase EthA [Fusarium oxysporum f. sp. albedinis]
MPSLPSLTLRSGLLHRNPQQHEQDVTDNSAGVRLWKDEVRKDPSLYVIRVTEGDRWCGQNGEGHYRVR